MADPGPPDGLRGGGRLARLLHGSPREQSHCAMRRQGAGIALGRGDARPLRRRAVVRSTPPMNTWRFDFCSASARSIGGHWIGALWAYHKFFRGRIFHSERQPPSRQPCSRQIVTRHPGKSDADEHRIADIPLRVTLISVANYIAGDVDEHGRPQWPRLQGRTRSATMSRSSRRRRSSMIFSIPLRKEHAGRDVLPTGSPARSMNDGAPAAASAGRRELSSQRAFERPRRETA